MGQEEISVAAGELWRAARRGDRAGCLTMLRAGVPDINHKSETEVLARNRFGLDSRSWRFTRVTVLHIAALQGWADVCRAILAAPCFTEAGALAVRESPWGNRTCSTRDFGNNKGAELSHVLERTGRYVLTCL